MEDVSVMTTTDRDAIRIVGRFIEVRPDIKTYGSGNTKLLQRAERLDIHAMDDDAFEALVARVKESAVSSA